MAAVKRARGKRSVAISDRSGFKVPYTSLKTTWEGLRVEPEEYEPKHPQLTPPRNVVDATALFDPRPDTDPENVDFFVGYNYDIFLDPQNRPGVGISGKGTTGFLDDVHFDYIFDVTGVSATGNVGQVIISDNEDVVVTGVAGTGATGTEVIRVEAIPSGVAGTGAIGTSTLETDAQPAAQAGTGAVGAVTLKITIDAQVTGVAGTGAVGTEIPESIINETGLAGTGAVGTSVLESIINETGVAGTGAVGTEVPESVINETGVAGTGAVEGFGVAGNGNVQLIVTGISGIGSTGTTGNEVSVAEIIETGVSGTGAVGTATAQINLAWGEGAWGEGPWGE